MPKGRAGQSAFKLNSVGAQFRTQLRGLMSELNTCAPHYIRCLSALPCNVVFVVRHVQGVLHGLACLRPVLLQYCWTFRKVLQRIAMCACSC